MTRYLVAWAGGLTIAACALATADQDRTPAATPSARTKAEEKIDTRLRAAIQRLRAKETGTPQPGASPGTVDIDKDGRALVDIEARVSAELRGAIETAGGVVLSEFPQFNAVRARVSLGQLEKLAERSDVKFIRTADQPITNNPSGAVR